MRVIVISLLLLLFPLLVPVHLHAMVNPAVTAPIATANLERLLERAISDDLIAGGVVVVGNHEGILATAARGQVSSSPGAPGITDRTMFDLASLTKVVATTPAVIKLLDEGRIALTDHLSRWFPELAGTDKGEITVLNLMTHTSGLSDVMVGPERGIEGLLGKVAAQRARPAGARFEYADVNFILLGELVHRVTGERLDRFCREEIYEPLGTRETSFLPSPDAGNEIAPTSGATGGVVQDQNARRLGGVAGHAGLFSSGYDLARYARLMLGGGTLDGRRILSEQAVARMTTPYLCSDGRVKRGLGWDMASPFSAPKGTLFSDASYGHTGYSGSSIWIDPQQDMFVIMLTRRVDYRNVHDFNQLRRNVSTVAAADFKGEGEAAPAYNAEGAKAQVVATTAVHHGEPRRVRLASIGHRDRHRVARCSVKPVRRAVQARVRHRAKVTARVAKNDAVKARAGGKKHRLLPRS